MKRILIISLLPLLLSACSEEIALKEMPVKSVKALTITKNNLSSVREISGTVTSTNTTNVSFRVSGLVNILNVNTGDKITAGQVLAKLKQREFELAINSAQAELSSARANFSERQEELNRQVQLKSQGFVAQSSVEQAQAAFNSAQSDVQIAQSNLETAQNNFSYTILKSPVSGVVASRSIEPFAEISAGQSIFELHSDNELEVDIIMPEALIGEVKYGDLVSVSFPSINEANFKATITQIATTSETGSGFPVTAKLINAPEQLLSGMTARVAFNFGEAIDTDVYVLPITAIDTRIHEQKTPVGKNQAPVFVINSNIAKRRLVTTRDVIGNKIEIIGGLEEGDTVIVAGVSFINDGQVVNVWTPNYNLPASINQ